MKRALILASVASMIDQFNRDNIKILQDMGYVVEVACNFREGSTTSKSRVAEFREELANQGIITYHLPIPRKLTAVKAMKVCRRQIRNLVESRHYALVHCQSPIGGALTRMACKKARKKGTKVIYMAHGFHFYKGASPLSWMLFYPVEKLLAAHTDVLVTINKEDYCRAKESFHAGKVMYVPGVGVDVDRQPDTEQKQQELRKQKRRELGIPEDAFLCVSVGELNKGKNHKVLIQAWKKMSHPGRDMHLVICGKGDLQSKLKSMISFRKLQSKIILAGYREDIKDILLSSDCFVFPSKREGLSVALMEAMAAGLPVVCSKIRGNVELVDEGKGGYLCESGKPEEYAQAVLKIAGCPSEETGEEDRYRSDSREERALTMGRYNRRKIQDFSKEIVRAKMKEIYGTCQ